MYWIIHNNIVSNKYGGNNMSKALKSTVQQLQTLDIQGLLDLVKSTFHNHDYGSCGESGSYKKIEIFQDGSWKELTPFEGYTYQTCDGKRSYKLTNKDVAKQLLELTNSQFFRVVSRDWSEWSGQDHWDTGKQYTYFGLNME